MALGRRLLPSEIDDSSKNSMGEWRYLRVINEAQFLRAFDKVRQGTRFGERGPKSNSGETQTSDKFGKI